MYRQAPVRFTSRMPNIRILRARGWVLVCITHYGSYSPLGDVDGVLLELCQRHQILHILQLLYDGHGRPEVDEGDDSSDTYRIIGLASARVRVRDKVSAT